MVGSLRSMSSGGALVASLDVLSPMPISASNMAISFSLHKIDEETMMTEIH